MPPVPEEARRFGRMNSNACGELEVQWFDAGNEGQSWLFPVGTGCKNCLVKIAISSLEQPPGVIRESER